VAQILACATPGLNAVVCPAVIVGLTFAAGGSFGESIKSIAFTFATMGVFSGVGTVLQGVGANFITRVLVHGVVGGALSVAQGGSFSAGFLSNAAGAGISGLTGGIGGSDFGSVVVRTAIAAAAGGTASILAGGKFANGAISAAFAHLYNQEDVLGTHSEGASGTQSGETEVSADRSDDQAADIAHGDRSVSQCFGQCAMKHYGLAEYWEREAVAAGLVPISKRFFGLPIPKGASEYTNLVSLMGLGLRDYGVDFRMPWRIMGTTRFWGAVGRSMPYVAVGIGAYDAGSISYCTYKCAQGRGR
jgi:hypothetical protein